MSVYPNPTNDRIMVSGIDAKNTKAIISLFDVQGRMIRKENMQSQNGTIQLSVADLNPGIYLMMIRDDAGNMLHQQKIVKMK